jgi:Zn-dependent membrane protease YugP
MKESGWKKWTGSRTGKNLTGREMTGRIKRKNGIMGLEEK